MKQTSPVTILPVGSSHCADRQYMEFHINAALRKACNFTGSLFSSSGNVIFANFAAVQEFAQQYNRTVDGKNHPEHFLKTGQLNAMGLLDEIFHYVCRLYREQAEPAFFSGALTRLEDMLGADTLDRILLSFVSEFPPRAVYRNKTTATAWLSGTDSGGIAHRIIALEELVLLHLANENPAFEPFSPIFSDEKLGSDPAYRSFWNIFRSWSAENPPFGPENRDLVSMLKAPVDYSPFDLKGQLEYVRTRWADILGEWLARLLSGLDLIAEEEKPGWGPGPGTGGYDLPVYDFDDISKEYERFSPDREWMPNVVMIAKSTLVWLDQLSKKYGRSITRLDQIPDEELDFFEQAGFTGLWLIGVWERSPASARIKQICGNPEAAASAYSLNDYEVANELGGWEALDNLRSRAWKRGIRMASDMVPNHTGMDSSWVINKPDMFVQTKESPFPGYDFSGENLSHDDRVGIYLENHYYSKTDCAVVFKRVDHHTGDTRYIYHGNDGTGMPWNDTAQIDFLQPEAREEVIRKILHVASNFPIIRFDAAMVLAKKHIQRLWYPEPGKGGDIASRSHFALTREEFERRIPEEFWREVVDRCAKEIPDTLLLAEAFWMMEGYFVRTLGMHRVYNSAFMNMLKREENEKYRSTIKNTIEFDPEILKRYVNFMNNPDEETAVAQFGRGDKYYGVCTMMAAMPGLPMFGHGQIEGFEEKYGMEYRRAYRDEVPDSGLVARHQHEIFPLMKRRYLFAGVEHFLLYDFWENGAVNENVFVWSNRAGGERALIFYNNVYQQATGWIQRSAAYAKKNPDGTKQLVQRDLWEGLGLTDRENRFCIFQEQRSGLWYIRTVREMVANGFFASLNGFQTQVFLNIHEMDDNKDKHYRQLYESLGGNGIPDIHMGIQNIVLRDLYAALVAFASPEYFKTIRDILSMDPKKRDERIKTFFSAIHKPALKFFTEIGRLPEFSGEKTDPKAAAAWHERYLERLFEIATVKGISRPVFERLEKSLPGFAEALSAATILFVLRYISKEPLSGEQNRKFAGRYDIDRKLLEIMHNSGICPHDSCQAFTDLEDFISYRDIFDEQTPDNRWVSFFNSAEVQRQMDVHPWDKVLWFSKEKSEHMIDLLKLSMTMFTDSRETTRTQNTKKMDRTLARFTTLFTESGYQFEKLIANMIPERKKPVSRTTKSGKTTTTKTPDTSGSKK